MRNNVTTKKAKAKAPAPELVHEIEHGGLPELFSSPALNDAIAALEPNKWYEVSFGYMRDDTGRVYVMPIVVLYRKRA